MGLAKQVFAPNSPQWFNTGVWWAYGTEGSSAAYRPLGDLTYTVENEDTGEDESVTIPSCHRVGSEAYRYPQTSACFILGVEDNLVDKDGIFETLSREAQIFKYGSGAGANFSKLRHKGAPLSSGGQSSGLMSFLKVLDTAAGAIKSGGTTRRAAKMVVVNADHPDALDFAHVKAREELKIRVLQDGAKAAIRQSAYGDRFDEDLENLIGDWESDAHNTVDYQNANHSIRFTDEQMDVIRRAKTGIDPQTEEERAILDVWREMCQAAWECADPGIQFDTTCNTWHTIPAVDRQNGTNPCSEYSFIDNSASINVMRWTRRTTPISGAMKICCVCPGRDGGFPLPISDIISRVTSPAAGL